MCLQILYAHHRDHNVSLKADKMISNVYCIKEVNIYLKLTKTLYSYLNITLVNSNDVSVIL